MAEHPDRVAAVAIRNLSPQEQLLSHGSLAPLAKVNAHATISIPLIQGADGTALSRAFRKLRL